MDSNKLKMIKSAKILGLDVSTKTIGFALFEISSSKLLELTHFFPKKLSRNRKISLKN